jgi:hypothetical protein
MTKQRGSLISESEFESIGRKDKGKKSSGGGRGSQDIIKIGVALGLLLVAAGLLAWNFGLIDLSPRPEPVAPEVIQAHQERVQKMEEDVAAGRMPPPGVE